MLLVSACLAGTNCKYNGLNNMHPQIKELVRSGKAIPICPEQLGGLPTPRLPAEITAGDGRDVLEGKTKVVDSSGKDVTGQFLKGAEETLQLARTLGTRAAILKEGSPSCGSSQIADGSFSGKKVPGSGVAAALLKKEGFSVYSENNPEGLGTKPGKNRLYIGVIGAADCCAEIETLALEVGQEIARQGAVLICGGRGGVMEAAARGASIEGGTAIGILPGFSRQEANSWLSYSIPTGLGEARNAIIARAADVLIAVSGGYGTMSEIALGLKMGKPVIGLKTWQARQGDTRANIKEAASAKEAVRLALLAVKNRRGSE